jgi:ABC-type dipeptide/oligopeptide/nickel transport system permease component
MLRVRRPAGLDAVSQKTLDQRFGFNLPLWRQFLRYVVGDVDDAGQWFCGLLCGNLGPSTQQRGRSVQAVLFEPPEGQPVWHSRFGYSLRLVLFGAVLTVSLGIPWGLFSALRHPSRVSQAISVGLAVVVSISNFVWGLLVILVLASGLKLMKVLPDWDEACNPWMLILPSLGLLLISMSFILLGNFLAGLTRAERA